MTRAIKKVVGDLAVNLDIILIGPMRAGKSALGKLLAERPANVETLAVLHQT